MRNSNFQLFDVPFFVLFKNPNSEISIALNWYQKCQLLVLFASWLQLRHFWMMFSHMNAQITTLLRLILTVWTFVRWCLAATFNVFVSSQCRFPAVSLSAMPSIENIYSIYYLCILTYSLISNPNFFNVFIVFNERPPLKTSAANLKLCKFVSLSISFLPASEWLFNLRTVILTTIHRWIT